VGWNSRRHCRNGDVTSSQNGSWITGRLSALTTEWFKVNLPFINQIFNSGGTSISGYNPLFVGVFIKFIVGYITDNTAVKTCHNQIQVLLFAYAVGGFINSRKKSQGVCDQQITQFGQRYGTSDLQKTGEAHVRKANFLRRGVGFSQRKFQF
jgi:hypothetical protein